MHAGVLALRAPRDYKHRMIRLVSSARAMPSRRRHLG
jgi:hypothetical protein